VSAQPNLHILAVLVENKFGVLARVAGLFSRRGFNILSLTVAPTDDPALSRITVVVDVDNTDVAQIAKQLNKLINVLEIKELQPNESVERELMMARISAVDSQSVGDVLDQFGGTIVDKSATELIVSIDAHPDELDKCELALNVFDIRELQRTGRIALGRLGS
jgi:acetolactate synthase I/III small subunit